MMNRLNITKSEKYLMAIITIYHKDTWWLTFITLCFQCLSCCDKSTLPKNNSGEERPSFSALATLSHWEPSGKEHKQERQAQTTEEHSLPAHAYANFLLLPRTTYLYRKQSCPVQERRWAGPSHMTFHHRPISFEQSLNCPLSGGFRLCQANQGSLLATLLITTSVLVTLWGDSGLQS